MNDSHCNTFCIAVASLFLQQQQQQIMMITTVTSTAPPPAAKETINTRLNSKTTGKQVKLVLIDTIVSKIPVFVSTKQHKIINGNT